MYQYRARLIRVVDADTLQLAIDLGFSVSVEQTVRLTGLDAPEKHTPAGAAATAFTAAWLAGHPGPYLLETTKREKYGRYLGTVRSADGACLNADLIAAGHAVPYSGGPRTPTAAPATAEES
jgi:micrococcal nuclease